jgi:hypothetical protein
MTGRRFFSILAFIALLQYFPTQAYAQQQTGSKQPSESEIKQIVAANWMSNYPDNKFYPEKILTRAELASIMVKVFRLDKRPAASQSDVALADVPASHPAFRDIQLVVKTNIMKGYRGNLFFPNQKVTRAEGLAIFAQAYGVFQFSDETVREILAPYADAALIPTWARQAIATVAAEGFINTDAQNNISPLKPMTRGDMAYVLSQYLQRQQPQPQTPEAPPAPQNL